MHDPMTVAFEIPNIFARPFAFSLKPGQRRQYPALITIWHVDPEKKGDDDSCDWFGRNRPLNAREAAIVEAMWDLETLLDNRPHYPDSREHKAFQHLKEAVRLWRQRPARRWHPRWHVHHWRIQVRPWQQFCRWAFSRCQGCGGRFPWGYCPVSGSWHSRGPQFLRGEPNVWHEDCSESRQPSKGSPVSGDPSKPVSRACR